MRIETPVLIISSTLRFVVRDDLPPGHFFLVDGETFCVNGEYPYTAKDTKETP